MSSTKRPTVWTSVIESGLVDMVAKFPVLWKARQEEDLGSPEMVDIAKVREHLNNKFLTGFSIEMVTKKWLEIALLFDLKYALNGYTMADRGKKMNRDGSVKDDLNESWELFHKLEFLINPNAGQGKNSRK